MQAKTGFYKCESVDFHIYKMWFSFCFKIEHIICILERKGSNDHGEKIMKIDKVMNNNVVSSIDEDGQEIIVVGTGIGFQGKEGKVVDEKKIQKIFRLEDPKMIRKLKEILQDLPMEQFEISTAIIEHAKAKFRNRIKREYLCDINRSYSFCDSAI